MPRILATHKPVQSLDSLNTEEPPPAQRPSAASASSSATTAHRSERVLDALVMEHARALGRSRRSSRERVRRQAAVSRDAA